MQGQRLNLKFSVRHTDEILASAKSRFDAASIAESCSKAWGFPVSKAEVSGICDEAGVFVRTRNIRRWSR